MGDPWEVFIFGIFKTYQLAPQVLWLCCSIKSLNKSSNIAQGLLIRWSMTNMQLFKVYNGNKLVYISKIK